METKRSILQIYSTIVGIVCVITFLISAGNIISAAMDRSNPMFSGRYDQSLTSFEHFKLEALKGITKDQVYVPNDNSVKEMYDAAKKEKVERVLHQTQTTMVVFSILLLASIVLFAVHWKWIKAN